MGWVKDAKQVFIFSMFHMIWTDDKWISALSLHKCQRWNGILGADELTSRLHMKLKFYLLFFPWFTQNNCKNCPKGEIEELRFLFLHEMNQSADRFQFCLQIKRMMDWLSSLKIIWCGRSILNFSIFTPENQPG